MSMNTHHMTPPVYTDETRVAGVLQQLQTMLESRATLADAIALLQHLQATYGESAELEQIIQDLTVRQLNAQYTRRQARRQNAMVAA